MVGWAKNDVIIADKLIHLLPRGIRLTTVLNM